MTKFLFFFFYFIAFNLLFSESLEVYEVTQPDEVINFVPETNKNESKRDNPQYFYNLHLKKKGEGLSGFSIKELYEKGKVYFTAKDYQNALKQYKAIIRRDKKQEDAYLMLAKIYNIQKDYEREALIYKTIDKLFKKDYKQKYHQALRRFLTQLKEFYLKYPDEAMLPAKIAEVYYWLGDRESAQKYSNEAIKIDKTVAKPYYILALIYKDNNDIENAYWSISRAFRLEPESQKYFELLNEISKLKEKIKKKPKKHREKIDTIYYTNALKYIERKEYAKALENLEKALKQYPDNSEIITRIAEVKKLKKQALLAQMDLKLAINYFEAGNYKKALAKLEGIIENNTDDLLDFLKFNRYLMLTYYKLNQWKDCINVAKHLLAQIPTNIEALYYSGISYEKIGMFDKAYNMFSKAISLKGEILKYPKIKKDLKDKLFFYNISRNKFKILLLIVLLGVVIGWIIYFYRSPIMKKGRLIKRFDKSIISKDIKGAQSIIFEFERMKISSADLKAMYLKFATLNFRLANYDIALNYARRVLSLYPSDTDAQLLIPSIYLKKGVINEEAMYMYYKLYKKEPKNIDLLRIIVKFLADISQNKREKWFKILGEDLTKIFETLYRYDQNNISLIYVWVYLGIKEGRNDKKMREIYERYLGMANDMELELPLKELLVKGYYAEKEYDKALKYGMDILEFKPDDQGIFMIVSDICKKQDRISWLIAELERFLNKRPGIVIYREYIERLRKEIKKHEEKIVNIAEDNNIDIDKLNSIFKEGTMFFKNGELNQAIANFKQVFKLSNDIHLKKRASKLLILSYIRKELFELAKEQYNITGYDEVNMSPDLKELCYLMGEAFEKAGLYKDALDMFDKICRVDVGYRDSFERFERLRDMLVNG